MSLRSLLRSVVEWIRPAPRVEPELRITPEQLRAALSAMLADPQTRGLLLRDLVGTVLPISGGEPACTPAGEVHPGTGATAGIFGSNSSCGSGEPRAYTFSPASGETGVVPLSVKGVSMQTADLQRWKKSDDTVLTVVDKDGKLGVRTANPIADTNLPVQISTAGGGSVTYFGANKNGAYGALFGFENGGSLGTGGIVRVATTDPLMFFVNDNLEAMRIINAGRVGIGTTTPNAKLSVGSGSLLDDNLPVQISTAGAGTKAYYGANKNGGYGVLFGFENQASLGTGGIVRVVSADPLMFFVNNITEAMRIISNGNVGIGRTDPLVKLHVKGGNLYIEGPGSVGRLGFLKDGATIDSGATQMWRMGTGGTPDNIILRTFTVDPSPSTVLDIKAPPFFAPPATTNREATLALTRELFDGSGNVIGSEFLDLYNNGYASETLYGIRIQKRDSGQYRDFVFDQSESLTKPNIPLLVLKANRHVWVGTVAAPGPPTLVVASGGSLNGDFFYKITALDSDGGETVGGDEASVTGLANQKVTVNWTKVPGAYQYRVYYGPTSGGQNKFFTVVEPPFEHTADTGTAGSPPTVTTAVVVKMNAASLALATNLFAIDGDPNRNAVRFSRGQPGFTGSESYRIVRGAKTTDANAVTIATIPLDTPRGYYFVARVAARKSDGTLWAFLYKAALAHRESGGAGVEPSVDVKSIRPTGTENWDCTFTTSGNDLLVQVKSMAAITVFWAATIEYQSVSTDA